jgi:hypothetical protein
MFKYDAVTGEPCAAILCDWQWGSVFNVASDLASLLYTSINADLRARCMDSVLRQYYRTFCHVLKTMGTAHLFPGTTFDDFELNFKKVGVYCAFETLKVVRIAFSRSDVEEGSPIMNRYCASLREILRERIKTGFW